MHFFIIFIIYFARKAFSEIDIKYCERNQDEEKWDKFKGCIEEKISPYKINESLDDNIFQCCISDKFEECRMEQCNTTKMRTPFCENATYSACIPTVNNLKYCKRPPTITSNFTTEKLVLNLKPEDRTRKDPKMPYIDCERAYNNSESALVKCYKTFLSDATFKEWRDDIDFQCCIYYLKEECIKNLTAVCTGGKYVPKNNVYCEFNRTYFNVKACKCSKLVPKLFIILISFWVKIFIE